MGKKDKKVSKRLDSSTRQTNPEDIRKHSYILALQSDIMTVLVGPTEKVFRNPQDFLIQYSQVLGRMCCSEFKEIFTRTIQLPEVEVSVFEDFRIWLYAYIASRGWGSDSSQEWHQMTGSPNSAATQALCPLMLYAEVAAWQKGRTCASLYVMTKAQSPSTNEIILAI